MKTRLYPCLTLALALFSCSTALADISTNVLLTVPPVPTTNQAAPGAKVSKPVTQIITLVQSNVPDEVVTSYIDNSPSTFNLTPENIIYLHSLNFPSKQITAMLQHDRVLREKSDTYLNAKTAAMEGQSNPPPLLPPIAPEPSAQPDQPQPEQPADMPDDNPPEPQANPATDDTGSPQAAGYFYDSLAPYGAWSSIPGQGWCWQPSVAAANRAWTPYCDQGQWFSTDCGWYWNSYYPWGWAPFHYGRWSHNPKCGWLWFPGRAWAPSWVTWRSSGKHSGWAPLPPGSSFDSKSGLRFKQESVSANCGFGLGPNDFTFVPEQNFGAWNLRPCRLNLRQANQAFANSRVINDFVVAPNGILFNKGLNINAFNLSGPNHVIHARLKDSASPTDAGFFPSGSVLPSTVAVFRPQIEFRPSLSNNPQPTSRDFTYLPVKNPDPAANLLNRFHGSGNPLNQKQEPNDQSSPQRNLPVVIPPQSGPPFAPATPHSRPAVHSAAPAASGGGGRRG